MAAEIPRQIRTVVIERAQGRCEYCQKPDDRELNFYRHEVDHVIAEKHGGRATLENLAYACFQCNRYKGTDIASLDPQTGILSQLFNPRMQQWHDHFQLNADGTITSQTSVGRTTAALLRFHDPLRVQIRATLIAAGKLSILPGCA